LGPTSKGREGVERGGERREESVPIVPVLRNEYAGPSCRHEEHCGITAEG